MYIPQTDAWRKDKLGEIYTVNKTSAFMLIQDRSLFTLQQYGVAMSEKEFLAIKLHDGLYDDSNKAYYISFNPDSKFRTNLINILHQADLLASKIEYDRHIDEQKQPPAKVEKVKTTTRELTKTSQGLANLI